MVPHLTKPAEPALTGESAGRPAAGNKRVHIGRIPRFWLLAILFTAEALLFSIWLDNASLASQDGFLPRFLGQWDAWVVRGVVGIAGVFFTFAYLKNRAALSGISAEAGRSPVRWGLLAAHAAAMAVFAILSQILFGSHAGVLSPNAAALLWLIAGAAGFLSAAFALIAPVLWIRLIRETGFLLIYTVVAVVPACLAGAYIRELWAPLGRVTFALVEWMLHPFLAQIVADPVKMTLGSPRFWVEIAPECSGFEGVGLILGFGVLWLFLFRSEIRFPHALLLLPAGVATIFLLNAVRLAALILIGDAGAPEVALGGFHSQAGWISFNIVALAFAVAARRVPWLTTAEVRAQAAAGAPSGDAPSGAAGLLDGNPTAAFLLPFLSILVTGLLTTAVSGGFEWLYPLRFFAAATALWALRKWYATLDWRVTWFGPAMGVAVFAIWIAVDSLSGNGNGADRMPAALRDASAMVRLVWLSLRVLAAVVTVPIAEELAFRGFLLRRFTSVDFETVRAADFRWIGLVVSSVAFGLLHGKLWFAGVLAGLLYGWAMVRRGRFGDAVVAHALTNALLAVWVMGLGKWHLW